MVTFLHKCYHKTLITALSVSSLLLILFIYSCMSAFLHTFTLLSEWIMNKMSCRTDLYILVVPTWNCTDKIPPLSLRFCACVCAFGSSMSGIRVPVAWASADGTTRQSEGIWYRTVKLTNDFINPLLPAGVAVSASPNGWVKLPQGHLGHLDEPLWDLQAAMSEHVKVCRVRALKLWTHFEIHIRFT